MRHPIIRQDFLNGIMGGMMEMKLFNWRPALILFGPGQLAKGLVVRINLEFVLLPYDLKTLVVFRVSFGCSDL